MKYCPNCNNELTADTEVYTTYRKSVHEGVEIIGCDNCIRSTYADEFFDEDKLESDEEHILWNMDDIWADMRAGIW